MNDFHTPAQLAKDYPVSKSTIYSACQDGLLPYYRVPAKRGKYLIELSDFLSWLESNRREAGDAPDDEQLSIIRWRPSWRLRACSCAAWRGDRSAARW